MQGNWVMKIGLLRVKLKIPSCSSLKSKRSIIKKYINRLRRDYNVAVAEIGNHNQPYACSLGIVTIFKGDQGRERILEHILDVLDHSSDILLADYLIEII